MTNAEQFTQHAMAVLARRYEAVSLLKPGETGLVFTAHPRGNAESRVVIKVAYPADGSVQSPDTRVRFHRECEVGAKLSHPHIVRVSPAETLDEIEFYEMDAQESQGSQRLDHLVLSSPPPDHQRVLAIMHALAEAFDYAHAEGIVHGALRPSSVSLDENGKVTVKGFLLYENQDAPHPTLEPATLGDAAYMAPEQWREPRARRAVDVYAVGILAYELFTGQTRVEYDESGTVPMIRPIELAPNRPLRSGIPLHVNAAIRRAINKDPAMRFKSVGEFVNALVNREAALAHSLPTLVPATRSDRSSAWMLVVLVLGAALTGLLIPSHSRTKVLRWTKSALLSRTATFDPFKRVDRSPQTTTAASTPRDARSASRARSETTKSPKRDTGAARGATARRSETERMKSGVKESAGVLVRPSGAAEDSGATPSERSRSAEATSGQPAATKKAGVLRITVDQGRALVVVNGVPRGYAPVSLSVRGGTYRITLRGALKYDPKEMRVTVAVADTAFAEFYATNAVPPDTTVDCALPGGRNQNCR